MTLGPERMHGSRNNPLPPRPELAGSSPAALAWFRRAVARLRLPAAGEAEPERPARRPGQQPAPPAPGETAAAAGGRTEARWWTVRRAQNRKPSNYLCPLCGGRLHAMSEHMLIAPEDDAARRRHAHTGCVVAARRAGDLPTLDEFRRMQPRSPGLLSRLRRHARLDRRPD